jgi:hypothetical protein
MDRNQMCFQPDKLISDCKNAVQKRAAKLQSEIGCVNEPLRQGTPTEGEGLVQLTSSSR